MPSGSQVRHDEDASARNLGTDRAKLSRQGCEARLGPNNRESCIELRVIPLWIQLGIRNIPVKVRIRMQHQPGRHMCVHRQAADFHDEDIDLGWVERKSRFTTRSNCLLKIAVELVERCRCSRLDPIGTRSKLTRHMFGMLRVPDRLEYFRSSMHIADLRKHRLHAVDCVRLNLPIRAPRKWAVQTTCSEQENVDRHSARDYAILVPGEV